MVAPPPWMRENVAGGRPQVTIARLMAVATSSAVPGWARWALTTTVQPAASAGAGDGEREGEVGGAEDDDGTEGDEHAAEIGAREWLAVGQRGIDPRVDPGPLANERGEEAELAARAAAFADQACLGQSGLGVGALNKRLTQGFDFKGDGFEELRALRARALPVGGEGHGGSRESGGDFGGGRLVKRGLHLGTRRRIGGVKCFAAGLTGSAGEEAEAVEEHGGK